jgi:hypothetical protein
MEDRRYEGGCLCGATRFEVTGIGTNRGYCHCRSCRLAAGAPLVAWATFPASQLRVTRGTLAQVRSSAKVVRSFCPACGTALTYAHDARPGELDVTLAALDDASSLAPEFHIWVSNKLPWFTIGDGLPQHAEWR